MLRSPTNSTMGSPVLTPMSAGNPPKVAPGSNIATTVTSNGSTTFVYYQDTTGGILESRFDGRTWTGGASDLVKWYVRQLLEFNRLSFCLKKSVPLEYNPDMSLPVIGEKAD